MYFAFLVRVYDSSEERFSYINAHYDLDAILKEFYERYEACFKMGACVPNIHLFAHLLERRQNVTLLNSSTEAFETFYAIVRNAYARGTMSQGKQMLQNILAYYLARPNHQCRRKLTVRPEGKGMRVDCWIETPSGPAKVIKILERDVFEVKKVVFTQWKHKVAAELPWHEVWVRKYLGLSEETYRVTMDQIISKGVLVDNRVIMSTPQGAMFN